MSRPTMEFFWNRQIFKIAWIVHERYTQCIWYSQCWRQTLSETVGDKTKLGVAFVVCFVNKSQGLIGGLPAVALAFCPKILGESLTPLKTKLFHVCVWSPTSPRATIRGFFFTKAQIWLYWHCCQLCVPIYLQFPSLFVTYGISKYEMRYSWVLWH